MCWVAHIPFVCMVKFKFLAHLPAELLLLLLLLLLISIFFYKYSLLKSFSHHLTLMFFHWSLKDSKTPQVSRTLLGILADLNYTVVLIVSSPFINASVTVPRAPITISINVTLTFESLFMDP